MMAEEPVLNPAEFKETTRRQWQEAAAAWHRWGAVLRDWLGPVTTMMLDLARLGPGDVVLDVAAGAGEPALSAAERVGPSGKVLATDISANILSFARLEARERGLSDAAFQTLVMDGENLDLEDDSFTVAFSRLGLIYFPDRVRGLSEMRRVLTPGGRAVVASFTTPERNRFFSMPIGIIRRRAHLAPPTPDQPGPFSLGSDAVMAETFAQAGFHSIETHVVAPVLHLPSAATCVQFERESFAALHQMMSDLSDAERTEVWAEIEQELRQFEEQSGFETPTELRIGIGMK
jgi:ubiquinone/menaquinone biosynthesis C-methylase UbiE